MQPLHRSQPATHYPRCCWNGSGPTSFTSLLGNFLSFKGRMNSWAFENSWTKLELRTRPISLKRMVYLPINLPWRSSKYTVSKYTLLWLLEGSPQHAKRVSYRSGTLMQFARKIIEFEDGRLNEIRSWWTGPKEKSFCIISWIGM